MADLPPITSTVVPIQSMAFTGGVMLTMDPDGTNVKIDWGMVQRYAGGNDRMLTPVAKALLAVRDKNYSEMAR